MKLLETDVSTNSHRGPVSGKDEGLPNGWNGRSAAALVLKPLDTEAEGPNA
jgi:hypothetical protein